jgi:hypothetical protein
MLFMMTSVVAIYCGRRVFVRLILIKTEFLMLIWELELELEVIMKIVVETSAKMFLQLTAMFG